MWNWELEVSNENPITCRTVSAVVHGMFLAHLITSILSMNTKNHVCYLSSGLKQHTNDETDLKTGLRQQTMFQ